jgi:PhnB protein
VYQLDWRALAPHSLIRLSAHIQTLKEMFMLGTVRHIPEGHHSITPALTCRDAARAIEFYKKVFGAAEVMRMAMPDGKIGHAELKVGDSKFMLNDEFPGMAVAPSDSTPQSVSLYLYVEDVDSTFNRAVQAGSKVNMPVTNQFWGDRYGYITDPFGHRWGLATHVEDVAPDELERRSKEWAANMAKNRAQAAGQS